MTDKLKTADEMRALPVRITGKAEIFIGDEQILAGYPIVEDGISIQPWHGRLNRLTVTLLVGPVSVEVRPPRDTEADTVVNMQGDTVREDPW